MGCHLSGVKGKDENRSLPEDFSFHSTVNLEKKKKKELKALTLDDLEQVFLALPFLSLALTQTTSHRHQRG